MPTISIIVPVYNVERYLRKCIDSVIGQTYTDWELILINDGSQDDSGKICDEYAHQLAKIVVYHRVNCGVSAARNFGMNKAKGKWIMFLDSDDWLSRDCLEVCINEVYENKLDVLQFSHNIAYLDRCSVIVNKNTSPILSPDLYIQQESFNVCAGGSLFKKSLVDEHQLKFNESLRLAEDQVFMLNLFRNSTRLKFLNKPMYFYFQNPSSAVHNQRSCDLISACNQLILVSKEWEPAKHFVDTMCMVFLTDLVKLGNVSATKIKHIYTDCSPKYVALSIPKSVRLFSKLALFSPFLAVFILSLYFKLRK